MCVHVWLNHFVVQQKWPWHCKSTILQSDLKKKKNTQQQKFSPIWQVWRVGDHMPTTVSSRSWAYTTCQTFLNTEPHIILWPDLLWIAIQIATCSRRAIRFSLMRGRRRPDQPCLGLKRWVLHMSEEAFRSPASQTLTFQSWEMFTLKKPLLSVPRTWDLLIPLSMESCCELEVPPEFQRGNCCWWKRWAFIGLMFREQRRTWPSSWRVDVIPSIS